MKKKAATEFAMEYEEAISGKLNKWAVSARSRLALIILYDQFSRIQFRQSAQSFAHDTKAQTLCLEGLTEKMDQSLTLIERVFFYMPLVHAEDVKLQEKSIKLFQELVSLSMPETTQVYQLFLAYAYAHFRVIKEFGRFPQRNVALGRDSTAAELTFLKNA